MTVGINQSLYENFNRRKRKESCVLLCAMLERISLKIFLIVRIRENSFSRLLGLLSLLCMWSKLKQVSLHLAIGGNLFQGHHGKYQGHDGWCLWICQALYDGTIFTYSNCTLHSAFNHYAGTHLHTMHCTIKCLQESYMGSFCHFFP